jgi:hypothetical protein
VLLGYGGQGEVRPLNEGEAALSLSFGVFVVAKGKGDVVAAGRTAGAVAIAIAAALTRFAPAAGLPATTEVADDGKAGVLGVTPAAEIVVETDSTKELLKEHILFHIVSWTHELIIGSAGDYPAEVFGALSEVEWDRPGEEVASIDADTISDLGGD